MLNDWLVPFIITISYTVAAVVIGCRAKGDTDMNETKNWGVSGNTMGFLIMFFIVGAGQVSAFTFMGSPGWVITKGVAALYVTVYLALMNYTCYLVNPRITEISTKHGILTQAQAFGDRYESVGVRALGAVIGSIALVAYAVVQVIGCGYVLNVVTGGNLPIWAGELIILVAMFIYIFRSGLRALGWIAILQGVLMFAISFIIGGLLSYMYTGSFFWGNLFEYVMNSDKIAAITLPGLASNYGPVLWSTSILVCTISIWPSIWVMAAGAKDVHAARKGVAVLPIYQLVIIPMIIAGFVVFWALPNYSGVPDQAVLNLTLDSVPGVLTGFLCAGILAASQSSAEPLFQTMAFTWTNDVFGPLLKWNERKKGKVQRWLLLPIMFGIVFPIALVNPAQLVNILLVGYGFLAQFFPLTLGIWIWPRSTKSGALAGLVVGVAVTLVFTFVYPNHLGIHGGFWGLMVNIPVHIIVSLLTKPASKDTIKRYFKLYIIEKLYVSK